MTSPQVEELKSKLLDAARHLDDADTPGALAVLKKVPLTTAPRSLRLVAASLWSRIIEDGNTISAGERRILKQTLPRVQTAINSPDADWGAYDAIHGVEREMSPGVAAALLATTLWDIVLEGPEALFSSLFEVFSRGESVRCVEAWNQFVAERRDYVPTYWQFCLVAKLQGTSFPRISGREISRAVGLSDREDLHALFAVYATQMRQLPAARLITAARKVAETEQRHRVAHMMLGMGYTPADLPAIVGAFPRLIAGAEGEDACVAIMRAKLAGSEQRWQDALDLTGPAVDAPALRLTAALIRANALAHLSRCEAANEALDEIIEDERATPFVHARATFLRVNAALAEAGEPFPENRPPMRFAATPGRPLVQSLWVGPRLRWIEQLAIKSYLDNGWRFQLYAYEDVENVPEGCEVLDARAIIPSDEVFKEGDGSGLHAGSVGAFSDLFRYRMLYERGGMWTDTDVVNLKRYDPEGRSFVSTELSDADTVTLNGALMAAPARHPFVAQAYERAQKLLHDGDMFFTRIGPYLLGELIAELGVTSVELAPLGFLGPVNWMNTGSLLQPFETVAARPAFREAANLHVYTEMWRILGLGLDKPPPAKTYLGRLYRHHCVDPEAEPRAVVSA